MEGSNAFRIGKVTTSIIKHAHGCDHCELRDTIINDNMVKATCLRCENIET